MGVETESIEEELTVNRWRPEEGLFVHCDVEL